MTSPEHLGLIWHSLYVSLKTTAKKHGGRVRNNVLGYIWHNNNHYDNVGLSFFF